MKEHVENSKSSDFISGNNLVTDELNSKQEEETPFLDEADKRTNTKIQWRLSRQSNDLKNKSKKQNTISYKENFVTERKTLYTKQNYIKRLFSDSSAIVKDSSFQFVALKDSKPGVQDFSGAFFNVRRDFNLYLQLRHSYSWQSLPKLHFTDAIELQVKQLLQSSHRPLSKTEVTSAEKKN